MELPKANVAGESQSVTKCLCPRVRVNALNWKLMTSLLLIPSIADTAPRCQSCLQFSSQEEVDEWAQRGGASVRGQNVQPRPGLTWLFSVKLENRFSLTLSLDKCGGATYPTCGRW